MPACLCLLSASPSSVSAVSRAAAKAEASISSTPSRLFASSQLSARPLLLHALFHLARVFVRSQRIVFRLASSVCVCVCTCVCVCVCVCACLAAAKVDFGAVSLQRLFAPCLQPPSLLRSWAMCITLVVRACIFNSTLRWYRSTAEIQRSEPWATGLQCRRRVAWVASGKAKRKQLQACVQWHLNLQSTQTYK